MGKYGAPCVLQFVMKAIFVAYKRNFVPKIKNDKSLFKQMLRTHNLCTIIQAGAGVCFQGPGCNVYLHIVGSHIGGGKKTRDEAGLGGAVRSLKPLL
jgi:hypothetical protein